MERSIVFAQSAVSQHKVVVARREISERNIVLVDGSACGYAVQRGVGCRSMASNRDLFVRACAWEFELFRKRNLQLCV